MFHRLVRLSIHSPFELATDIPTPAFLLLMSRIERTAWALPTLMIPWVSMSASSFCSSSCPRLHLLLALLLLFASVLLTFLLEPIVLLPFLFLLFPLSLFLLFCSCSFCSCSFCSCSFCPCWFCSCFVHSYPCPIAFGFSSAHDIWCLLKAADSRKSAISVRSTE